MIPKLENTEFNSTVLFVLCALILTHCTDSAESIVFEMST